MAEQILVILSTSSYYGKQINGVLSLGFSCKLHKIYEMQFYFLKSKLGFDLDFILPQMSADRESQSGSSSSEDSGSSESKDEQEKKEEKN